MMSKNLNILFPKSPKSINDDWQNFYYIQSLNKKSLKNKTTSIYSIFISFVFIFFFLNLNNNFAQTPGLIFDPATGSGITVLDPINDGYTSTTTSGFVSNDQSDSEIPFVSMSFPAGEGNSDVCMGPNCGFIDFVQQTAGIEDAGQYYLDASNNLIFRMRIGLASNNSKSYSVLIDIDQKFGSSGLNADPNYVEGNPGFEIEILLATNFGVYVYDLDGTTTPVLKRTYAGHTNYQKSIALSTDCSNPDYFYDFFVPYDDIISDFGILTSTPLRMTILTNMAANTSSISKPNTMSDLGGATCSNFETGVTQVIDNYTPTCITCSSALDRSACPVITNPIAAGENTVSGTSTEANTTTINVFKNGIQIGTTTVTAGAWSLTGISPALAAGNLIEASATAPGKGESIKNCNPITVALTCTAIIPNVTECNAKKGISGTAAVTGALINFYYGTSATPLTPTSGNTFSGATVTVDGTGAWLWRCVGTGQTTSCTAGGGPCFPGDGAYRVTQTASGQCESLPLWLCLGGAAATATPVITTNPILTTTTSVSGTSVANATIYLYANGIQIGTTIAAATTPFAWTISSLSLKFGEVITAKAVSSALCMSLASTSVTVSRISLAPTVSGTYCTSTTITSVTGTSTEPTGTVIQVFENGVAEGSTTTVDAIGNWIASTGISIASGSTITAKATITGGQQSAVSNSVPVGGKTATAVAITTSPITEGSDFVSGTGTNTNEIRLYVDGIQVGGTATVALGLWTIAGLGDYDLYTDGVVTATATATGQCESNPSASKIVQCNMPSILKTLNAVVDTRCEVIEYAELIVVSSESGVIYTPVKKSDNSVFGYSGLGTGSDLTLKTSNFTSAEIPSIELTVKAQKIGSSTCYDSNSNTKIITVNPIPDNTLSVVPANININSGETVNATITSSVSGISYKLINDVTDADMSTSVAGTGSDITITSVPIYVAQTIKVLATNNTTGCKTSLANKVQVGPSSLPIELVSFTANCKDKDVFLKWITASEINNDYFTIDKSIDAANWQTIAKVNGAGNSSIIQNYSFIDTEKYNGILYYRLNQTNFNGKLKNLNIISIDNCEDELTELTIYPNPASGTFYLKFNKNNEQIFSIKIFSSIGFKIDDISIKNKVGSCEYNIPQNAKGLYFIKVETNNKIYLEKIIFE